MRSNQAICFLPAVTSTSTRLSVFSFYRPYLYTCVVYVVYTLHVWCASATVLKVAALHTSFITPLPSHSPSHTYTVFRDRATRIEDSSVDTLQWQARGCEDQVTMKRHCTATLWPTTYSPMTKTDDTFSLDCDPWTVSNNYILSCRGSWFAPPDHSVPGRFWSLLSFCRGWWSYERL